MKSVEINILANLDITPKDLTTALATQLYEMVKLSLGQASELAGYSKSTFMELLGDYGVSWFSPLIIRLSFRKL